ncbi:MAG: hypothetical protein IKI30_08005 [Oxalobacter sp.]|nr:hypothetical protein [Oxalobacter sp.]
MMKKLILALSSLVIAASSAAYAGDCEGLTSEDIRKDCEIFGKAKAIEIDQCRDEGSVAAWTYDYKTSENYSPQESYKTVLNLDVKLPDARIKSLINEIYFGKYNKTYPLPGRLYYIVQDACLSSIGLKNIHNYESIVKKHEATKIRKSDETIVKSPEEKQNPQKWEPLK